MTQRRVPMAHLAGDRVVTLDADPSHYLARVLRLGSGDEVVLFDPLTAREADARVVSVDSGSVVLEVGPLRDASIAATREVTWIQGLAKGDKSDAVLRDATELGATRVIFAETGRSVVKLTRERAEQRATRWERIAREAARQCLRGEAPAISTASWRDALHAIDPSPARYVLDPNAPTKLGGLLAHVAREPAHPVAFAVGAEGGLTTDEVDYAEKQGWKRVSIGPVVLRTETMCAALLGALRVFSDT